MGSSDKYFAVCSPTRFDAAFIHKTESDPCFISNVNYFNQILIEWVVSAIKNPRKGRSPLLYDTGNELSQSSKIVYQN